jgi:hypothetical protein
LKFALRLQGSICAAVPTSLLVVSPEAGFLQFTLFRVGVDLEDWHAALARECHGHLSGEEPRALIVAPGAPGSLFQLCLLHEALQSVRQSRVCPNLVRTLRQSIRRGNEQIEKPLTLVTHHCKPRAYACWYLYTATCRGVHERRRLQRDQGAAGRSQEASTLAKRPSPCLSRAQSLR